MKRNLRVVPPAVLARLANLPNEIVVACAVATTADAVSAGRFAHLGISLDSEGLHLPSENPALPPASSGRFSKENIEGRVVVRRDLPKERYSQYVDTPNFGDSSRGYHTMRLKRERYPREEHAPALTRVLIRCADTSVKSTTYVFSFELDHVLRKDDPDFEAQLLRALNLLQENVGESGVGVSGTSFADYAATLRLDWEILPPGSRDEAILRIAGKDPSPQVAKEVGNRYDFLMKLCPMSMLVGVSGFNRYLGAQLRTELVVFENLRYGNALYIMAQDWQALSRLDRLSLLSGAHGANFTRVIHNRGWERHVVKALLEDYSYDIRRPQR